MTTILVSAADRWRILVAFGVPTLPLDVYAPRDSACCPDGPYEAFVRRSLRRCMTWRARRGR